MYGACHNCRSRSCRQHECFGDDTNGRILTTTSSDDAFTGQIYINSFHLRVHVYIPRVTIKLFHLYWKCVPRVSCSAMTSDGVIPVGCRIGHVVITLISISSFCRRSFSILYTPLKYLKVVYNTVDARILMPTTHTEVEEVS